MTTHQEWQSALEIDERVEIAVAALGVNLDMVADLLPEGTMTAVKEQTSRQMRHLVDLPQMEKMTLEEFTEFCQEPQISLYEYLELNEASELSHGDIMQQLALNAVLEVDDDDAGFFDMTKAESFFTRYGVRRDEVLRLAEERMKELTSQWMNVQRSP